ncbi:Protein of unknown function [Arthrobacter alpinus]|uniref:DUF3027 domain-containing protein n=1 Tax=Arthrobacter alpinus TaxID=656366 RepID=A0A1H5L7X6_9MICC|nr:DUF3027 domain-containing protein [Arthrobacter alpinus]SEE73205.1 Protein of unknown function [Arthrobacter alpinus]
MTELSGESTSPTASTDAPVAGAAVDQRPGIPVWRVGKPDAFLAAEVTAARTAVLTIAAGEEIGKHVGVRSEGVRCATHLFESNKPGYRGWVWFATLSRISRGKEATVNEVGMLPTEDSVLAPAWVPWSERVRPEDQQAADEAANHGVHGDSNAQESAQEEPDGEDDDAADTDLTAGAAELPQGEESAESN